MIKIGKSQIDQADDRKEIYDYTYSFYVTNCDF